VHGLPPTLLAAAALVVLALAALVLTRIAPESVRTVTMPATRPSATLVAEIAVADPVLAAAEREYEQAAQSLLETLQRRRTALPEADLARVEANIQVIDRALAEVRAALVKDPGNPELNRMLVDTHRKKVDVLRRVVRLATEL
jgi:hypothetical protein